MKIYLDNCCYCRPYDLSTEASVVLEAESKLYIQALIRYGSIKLISSFILYSEIIENPWEYKRNTILQFVDSYANEYVGSETKLDVLRLSNDIMRTGIKAFDAAHISCAILAKCDYFLTTDKRILKYKTNSIKLLNPVDFKKELEDMK